MQFDPQHKDTRRASFRDRVLHTSTSYERMPLLRLCIFTFLLMFAVGIATPIVPLYASSLGASWVEIGLLGTSWGLTFLLLAIIGGRISDRFGRRPLLLTSGIMSASAALLYLISKSVLQIILVRVFEGAAWALFWPTIEALATEIVNPRKTGQSMGMISISYGIAFALASLVSGSITGTFGYLQTFATYLMVSLSAIALAAFVLPRAKQRNRSRVTGAEERKLNFDCLRSRAVTMVYFLGCSYTFGLGAILTLFSVFAKLQGVAVFLIGLLFGLFWVGRIVGSLAGGHLSDRYGRGPAATLAMSGSSFGFVLTAFSTGVLTLFFAAVVLGFSIGAVFPVTVAIISDNVPQSVRGVAMGIYETSCAFGFLLAAAIGGLLSDLYSPRAPYLLAAGVSLVSAIIFALKRAQ